MIISESMIDIRQTTNYSNFLSSQGWKVERIDSINYFIKKIPLIGSIIKVQRPSKIDIKTIDKLERRYKAFETVIEPLTGTDMCDLVQKYGFKLSKNPFLPSKTIQIDLTQTKEDIFRKFTKDCKYSIRRGEDIKIKELSSPAEIKIFYKAWKNSVNFNRYVPDIDNLLSIKKSFPQSKSLFLTSHNKFGSIIGGAIFTTSSHDISNYITYYWYGFTNNEGRTSLSQYSLLYYAILWAKRNKYKKFDFEGIYDERFPNKSWLGFTHFKRSFGGDIVAYPGCYTRFRLPL